MDSNRVPGIRFHKAVAKRRRLQLHVTQPLKSEQYRCSAAPRDTCTLQGQAKPVLCPLQAWALQRNIANGAQVSLAVKAARRESRIAPM